MYQSMKGFCPMKIGNIKITINIIIYNIFIIKLKMTLKL